MRRAWKKLLSAALALVMCVCIVVPATAAAEENVDVADRAISFYEGANHEFVKISHPEKPTSTKTENVADGLVDYLGNGRVGVPGVDEGANGQGDRGHSYSWAAASYGDWMYVSTQYNPMMNTIALMGSGLGNKFDPEIMKSIINACYRGEFFVEEEDGGNPKSILCKINVKTGELHILMSMEKTGTNVNFRNALNFDGKLYFCGGVNGIPSIYEIDPANGDKITCVYQDESMKKPGAWPEALKKQLSPAIRGMCVWGEYLVINCVGLDENPYIAISKNPAEGFTKIAYAWEDVANQVPGELFGYPACHLADSIYGGSIWDITVFNNALYVAICTGTPANSPDGGKTMQSFAVVRGDCSGNPEERESWNWTPVIGDKEDGARYTFGIDPERTRSGACTMMVFKDHLYIGEYNDTEIALINFLFDRDLEFMAENLEQSVSLYRMDAQENIELVMGDPTEMFPESLSGMASGFDKHENQYIWRMDTFQGKLYMGTFDESSLLYPLGQFSNGDILKLTPEQWERQVKYLQELLDLLKEKEEKPEEQAVAQEMAAAFSEVEPTVSVLSLPATMGEEGGLQINSLESLQEAVILLGGMLENEDGWTDEELLQAKELFARLYKLVYDYYASDEVQEKLPESIQKILDELLDDEKMHKMQSLLRCLKVTSTAERGFDMVVTEDGIHFDIISRDGMGDPHNHGLRVFAVSDDLENPWMTFGTANPFYGTQIWRLQNDDLVIPGPADPDPEPETPGPNPNPNPNPDPNPDPAPEDPAPNPETNPDPVVPEPETKPDTEDSNPDTGDHFAPAVMAVVCMTSAGAFVVLRRRKQA